MEIDKSKCMHCQKKLRGKPVFLEGLVTKDKDRLGRHYIIYRTVRYAEQLASRGEAIRSDVWFVVGPGCQKSIDAGYAPEAWDEKVRQSIYG